ncbi:putative glycoside hydrolase [Methanobrevibacter sp. TMH8]|uniref:putative glycoside hydrolase n=1 Tax=Methanobrevibacter sp. TMH8 TaxID=2848611 RepID=UPI001CCDCEC4|nr:putative glycoside hydrolase [Methanobrevibacter sp. TMH8]MBZ9571051.1 putative glycoside hydrolase [Methanobrevibacter sp. TMH8]
MKRSELIKKAILIIIIFSIAIVASIFTTVMFKDDVGNGVWVQGENMNKVNLDALSNNGIKNIFLHSSAVDRFGEKNVSNWIKKANAKDIKVHIWVQSFRDGNKWVNPINTTTKTFNFPYFDSKVEEIEKYSEIPGVSGIQLDYLRYPGNAYKYDYPNGITSTNAINKFVSMVSDKIKDKNITLSITVMPEREDEKYYGQDIWTLSYYADAIIPMAYAGNYNQNSSWVKSIATYFKKEAMWSKVCIGIQTYDSDTNLTSLPASKIKENAQAALNGGADSIALFNWEMMKNWFNLRELS